MIRALRSLAACIALVALSAPAASADVDVLAVRLSRTAQPAYSDPANGASGTALLAELATRAKQARAQRIVFFIPGYNTAFPAAMVAARRIQTVLGPSDLVVDVDWGSHGRMSAYELDARAAHRSVPAFAQLLSDLHQALPGTQVDVFAHSMGARVAAGAMGAVHRAPDGKPLIVDAVLAAPDLNFVDYAHAIERDPEPVGHVTIYVSRRDRALFLSSIVHLHHRLGQLNVWRKGMAITDVVDATAADRIADGHGYAIHDSNVIRDIARVLAGAPAPHDDWTRSALSGNVWTYVPPALGAGLPKP